MNLFEKLLMAQQLSFSEGKIELLGQRVVISSPDWISLYTLEINNEVSLVQKLYSAAKNAIIEGSPSIKVKNKYSETLMDFEKLIGWGILEVVKFDQDKMQGTILISNSPVSTALRGQVKMPCDHLIRGVLAGLLSIMSNKNIDMLELECAAITSQKCAFVFGTATYLKRKFLTEYNLQI